MPRRIPDEAVLEDIRKIANILDRTPTTTDLINHGTYSQRTYTDRFDGIDGALEAAGLDPTDKWRRQGGIDDEELIQELQRLGEELGREPQPRDIRKESEFSIGTYHNHFETFAEALQLAGW